MSLTVGGGPGGAVGGKGNALNKMNCQMGRCKGEIGQVMMASNTLKWWQINTTALYPAPQDLTSTHSSLLASRGTMNTPDCSYGWPEGQEEAASRSSSVIAGHVWHWNLIVPSCSFVCVKKLDLLLWAIRPFFVRPGHKYSHKLPLWCILHSHAHFLEFSNQKFAYH